MSGFLAFYILRCKTAKYNNAHFLVFFVFFCKSTNFVVDNNAKTTRRDGKEI